MVKNKHIVGLGTVVVDQQMFMEKYPDWDTKIDVSSVRMQVGGPVPTALVLLSRWGFTCSFAGKWGDDHFGSLIEKDLQLEQLDLKNSVLQKQSESGFANVWVETSTGRRTITTFRGGFDPILPKDIDLKFFSNPLVLHLDGWAAQAAAFAAREVKKAGGRVFMDAGSPKEGYEKLLPLVDVLMCPSRFADQYFGNPDIESSAESLLRMGIETVVFTSGSGDIHLFSHKRHIIQKAFSVKAVDTTGAGDIFCGAFIYAALNNMENKSALEFAAAAASLKCGKVGNREALPSLEEVEKMILD